MPRLRLVEAARIDLRRIFSYIARESGSAAVADRFADRLLRQCRKLASLPGQMSRPRAELGSGIRSRAYGNYVILFRYSESRLEVMRILEGHRDIEAAFDVDPGDDPQG